MKRRRLLEGTRVVDLTVVFAAPFLTEMLADLGAEVIKVENIHVWNNYTRGITARPRKEEVDESTGWPRGFPDHDPKDYAWERDPWCLPLLRNKKSVTINTLKPAGRAYLHRLVAASDIVVENNLPSTMDRLEATYDDLRQHRADLIMVRCPAFGLDGAYSGYRAFGDHIESFIGHRTLYGYADADPTRSSAVAAGDYMTAAYGLFATLAAVMHRDATGEGQLIEIAQAESSAHIVTPALMEYALNGAVPGPTGNRDPQGFAPNGAFRCAGDDRWVAITVTDDGEWRALCAVIGRPDLAADERFATFAARESHQDELEAVVSEWTAGLSAEDAMVRLQSAGIAAGPVMHGRDALESPQLRERGFWHRIEHRFTGTWDWPGSPFRLPAQDDAPSLPPPGLGEHNEYVYREVLGVSAGEYAALLAAGDIGTAFAEGVG